MRLFVAVPVPDAVRDHVLDAVGDLRGDERLAWTRPDGWHATLAFVGETEDADAVVGATREAVGAAGVGAVRLTTGATDTLARRTALVLALRDDPAGAMERLGAALQDALADAGFAVARRRVRPHLTLGRARRRRPVPADVLAAVDVPPTTWEVEGLEVVQSILGDGPATYATVARVPVAG